MVAQPIPHRTNRIFIAIVGLSADMNPAIPKAAPSRTTPARIVFLRPILDATIPAGK